MLAGAVPAAGAPKEPTGLAAESWILVDPASGDVLSAQNPKLARPIASATKLMTYYLTKEQLRPRREITIARYGGSSVESLAGLVPGDVMTVEDVLYGLILPSGNDAASTLALSVAGSESDFVAKMNRTAAKLGLRDTAFADPIGLSSDNVSSAKDLVDLATELRKDALFRKITDTERITLRSGSEPIPLVNRNDLLLEEPFVDGVKTGTTLDAGFVLVASGRQNGVELVSAVLGAPDESSRDAASLSLLDYGFSLYGKRTLVRRGEPLGTVALTEGRGGLELLAGRSLRMVARDDQRPGVELASFPPVEGPVAAGERLGDATVVLDGEAVGRVPVVAGSDVSAPPAPESSGVPGWAVTVFAGAGLIAALSGMRAIAAKRRPQR